MNCSTAGHTLWMEGSPGTRTTFAAHARRQANNARLLATPRGVAVLPSQLRGLAASVST